MSDTSTRAPSAAKRSAIARPMPLPAPVTSAAFPRSRSPIIVLLSSARADTAAYARPPAAESTSAPRVRGAACHRGGLLTAALQSSEVSPSMRGMRAAREGEDMVTRAETLTSRELDILRLIACGCTDKEIAARLGRARRTVNISQHWSATWTVY
ncbi:MAG: response regulator transcription factor [Chloroflexota bacterium]|nr:response regulator transcription factor [Chloroflexota bacterium]